MIGGVEPGAVPGAAEKTRTLQFSKGKGRGWSMIEVCKNMKGMDKDIRNCYSPRPRIQEL